MITQKEARKIWLVMTALAPSLPNCGEFATEVFLESAGNIVLYNGPIPATSDEACKKIKKIMGV